MKNVFPEGASCKNSTTRATKNKGPSTNLTQMQIVG
jgi:hypothetical protein